MFERKPLRAEVGAEILGRIVDGRLPSGSRINESQLSQELGISRTPLREAMLCLATEGVLDSDMGRGFLVPALSGREIGDLLGALAVVLPAAVRPEPADPAAEFRTQLELGNLVGRARMHAGEEAALTEHLYRLLTALGDDGPNLALRRQCRELVRKSLRYFFEAHRRGWNAGALLDGLQAGLDRLRQGDRDDAARTFDRTLRELAQELAGRFPGEMSDEA